MHIYKSKPLVTTKSFYAVILMAIFTLGSFLAFVNLDKRSLLDWDEAYYLGVVKTWRAAADWITYKIFRPTAISGLGLSDYLLEYGSAINTFAKDGFLSIVFLFSYFLGLRDITILSVSGIFGILTLWLTYLIGKESFGGRLAGLFSCGILAVSTFQLHYSRSGFPQSVSVFFLYLAVILYIFSYKKKDNQKISLRLLFFSGFSLGYAFSCHYCLFWALPTFFFFEIANKIMCDFKIPWGIFFRRILLLFIGILAPILFWGIASELVKLILYRSTSSLSAMRGSLGIGSYVTYFSRLFDFIGPAISKIILRDNIAYLLGHADHLFYIRILLLWEGLFKMTLLVLAIGYFLYRQFWKRNFIEFVILNLFLAPFIYWSFHPWQLGRSFLAAIPAMALIIGSFLAQITEKMQFNIRTVVVFAITLILLFQAYPMVKKELSYASGYPAAIEFMKEHLGIKHLSSQFTISRILVGRKNALDISVTFGKGNVKSKLKKLYNEGYKYLLLDQMRIIFSDSPIVQAADKSSPIFIAPHSIDANLFENNKVNFAEEVYHAPKVLMIYELTDIINNLKEFNEE